MSDMKYKELDAREIGRRVRLRRELLELSREQLAERSDLSVGFISEIEYGKKGMSIETLYSLSKALNVSADYFLVGKIYDIEEDEEMIRFREEINATLEKCTKEQLRGVSQIIRIYEDGSRMK